MFGYLIASPSGLTEEELARYRACYCGLCRTLKERHGSLSRLTLNYDMTFLVLLLQSLYEDEERSGSARCPAHPRKSRDWWAGRATEYAADMNVALSYLKCMDNWRDEDSFFALAEAKALKKTFEKIKAEYPAQCAAMEQSIFELTALENAGIEDPDGAAATFGHLMGAVFCMRGDRWSDTLYAMGDAMGRFIYLLDAMVDLDADTRNGRYNPFRRYYGLENAPMFKDILKTFLADAVIEFEKLPLVQDVSLMKNILCSGLWSRFEEKYGPIQSSGCQP